MNLNQVTISTSDLTKAILFYEKLGLNLIVIALPRYARFECPNGESTFSIHHRETIQTKEGTIIYFECEHLDKKVSELKDKGIIFDHDPIDQSWLWREASLKDPDGNQVILYHAGENRKNPPWRIGPVPNVKY